jgi:hypothetical protein
MVGNHCSSGSETDACTILQVLELSKVISHDKLGWSEGAWEELYYEEAGNQQFQETLRALSQLTSLHLHDVDCFGSPSTADFGSLTNLRYVSRLACILSIWITYVEKVYRQTRLLQNS